MARSLAAYTDAVVRVAWVHHVSVGMCLNVFDKFKFRPPLLFRFFSCIGCVAAAAVRWPTSRSQHVTWARHGALGHVLAL
jgi:hypothetical protein